MASATAASHLRLHSTMSSGSRSSSVFTAFGAAERVRIEAVFTFTDDLLKPFRGCVGFDLVSGRTTLKLVLRSAIILMFVVLVGEVEAEDHQSKH